VLLIGEKEGQLWINSFTNAFFDRVFIVITSFAEVNIVLPIFVLILWFSYSKFLFLLSSFVTSGLITQLGKRHIFDEMYRPYLIFENEPYRWPAVEEIPLYMSFPSGHTTTAFAVFLGLSLVMNNKWLKLTFALTACIVGFSRVYLGMHFTRDICAGAIIGGGCALLWYFFFYGKTKPWRAKIGSKGLKNLFLQSGK
jgi:membrane-associated phospholipid phosphatase